MQQLIASQVEEVRNGSIEAFDNRQGELIDKGVSAVATYCQVCSSDEQEVG